MAREDIVRAALRRFASAGLAATSMKDIASDVGIKAPSIYAHFSSKDSLYDEAYALSISYHRSFFSELFAASRVSGPLERLRLVLAGVPEFYRQHPELANFHLRAAADVASPTRTTPQTPAPVQPPVSAHAPASARGLQAMSEEETELTDLVRTAYVEGRDQGLFVDLPPDTFTTYFLCLTDGLFLQLAYYDEPAYAARLALTWEAVATMLRPATAGANPTNSGRNPSTPGDHQPPQTPLTSSPEHH